MFGNIKSTVFTYGGIEAVELAFLQMLNISLRKIFTLFKVGKILVLTYKNQQRN